MKNLVNFANILLAALAPISFWQKITNPNLQANKSYKKHFHMKKLLIKCWPVVTFTYILRAAFVPISFQQKITNPN